MDTMNITDLLPMIEETPAVSFWEAKPPARVLLTGVGAPGAANLISALKEYDYHIIGMDMNPQSYGRFHCDTFYQSFPGNHPNFANSMLGIIEDERIDVVLSPITDELLSWSKMAFILDSINVPLLVTNCNAIEICLDKAKTYRMAGELSIPVAPWFVSHRAVRKPTHGKGSRGVEFFQYDQPSVFMEYIEGEEIAVDMLCQGGDPLAYRASERSRPRGGLHYSHEVVDAPHLVDHACAIASYLDYDWFINVQFIGDYLIEVNPRLSTTIFWGEYNLLHLGIQLALGNLTPEEILSIPPLPIGLKSFFHHGQITYLEEQWPVEGQ